MTKIEIEILMKLSSIIPQLEDEDKLYLLGLADGMTLISKKDDTFLSVVETESQQVGQECEKDAIFNCNDTKE